MKSLGNCAKEDETNETRWEMVQNQDSSCFIYYVFLHSFLAFFLARLLSPLSILFSNRSKQLEESCGSSWQAMRIL